MALPGDPDLEWENAQQNASVHQENQKCDEAPGPRSLYQAAGKQEAEVAKNETARTDVIGMRAAEQPHPQPTEEHHKERHAPKDRSPPEQDNPSQNDEGNGVRCKMTEAGVEEGSEE